MPVPAAGKFCRTPSLPAKSLLMCFWSSPHTGQMLPTRCPVAGFADSKPILMIDEPYGASCCRKAWMKNGLVPQQPPTKAAPADTKSGANPAKVSGLVR